MQPQAPQVTAQTPGPQVAPQGQQPQTPQPQGNIPAQQGQTPQQGQSKGDAAYDAKVAPLVEAHLSKLPDEQKAYLVQFMTPELAVIFGILLGQEAFQYFNQFVDPKKQLTVVPRQEQQGQQGAAQAPQQTPQPQQAPQQVQSAPQQAPQPQGKAPSIMGV